MTDWDEDGTLGLSFPQSSGGIQSSPHRLPVWMPASAGMTSEQVVADFAERELLARSAQGEGTEEQPGLFSARVSSKLHTTATGCPCSPVLSLPSGFIDSSRW